MEMFTKEIFTKSFHKILIWWNLTFTFLTNRVKSLAFGEGYILSLIKFIKRAARRENNIYRANALLIILDSSISTHHYTAYLLFT